MHFCKTAGYLAYPFLFISLFATPQLRAQSGTDAAPPPANAAPATPENTQGTPAQAAPETSAPAPAEAQEPAASSSQTSPAAPNAQERIRLAREAQERVRARRQQRVQAIVQDTYSHKYEASLGYAYLRLRPGHSLQNVTEAGWDFSLTDYIRPRLGITADLRGYYGTAYTGNNVYGIFKPFITNYSAMGGPQYRFVERRYYSVSGLVAAGLTRNLFSGNSQGFPGTLLGLYPDQYRFGVTAELPVDVNVSPALAVRIAPTYYMTTMGGETQNNRGFTLGLLYRFGRQ